MAKKIDDTLKKKHENMKELANALDEIDLKKDLEFIRREEFSTERLTTPPRLKAHSHETQQGVPI